MHKGWRQAVARPGPDDRDPAGALPADAASQANSAKEVLERIEVLTAEFTQRVIVGPLPPPDLLREYERLVPGSAERIISMAVSQSEHRKSLESTMIRGNQKIQTDAQRYGFWLSMVIALCGAVLAYRDQLGGYVIIVSLILGLVTVFLTGKKISVRELVQKQKAVAEISGRDKDR
jgi:uncharacterized membrane protein